MTIKNIDITSIEAKRFAKPNEIIGKFRTNFNSSITRVSKLGEKKAEIGFRYTANYSSIGLISFDGALVYEGGDVGGVVKAWEAEGKFPVGDAWFEIHNAVMSAGTVEAIAVGRTVKLPPPIAMPKVGPAPDKKDDRRIEVA